MDVMKKTNLATAAPIASRWRRISKRKKRKRRACRNPKQRNLRP
jgi:hypothetical protein